MVSVPLATFAVDSTIARMAMDRFDRIVNIIVTAPSNISQMMNLVGIRSAEIQLDRLMRQSLLPVDVPNIMADKLSELLYYIIFYSQFV